MDYSDLETQAMLSNIHTAINTIRPLINEPSTRLERVTLALIQAGYFGKIVESRINVQMYQADAHIDLVYIATLICTALKGEEEPQ